MAMCFRAWNLFILSTVFNSLWLEIGSTDQLNSFPKSSHNFGSSASFLQHLETRHMVLRSSQLRCLRIACFNSDGRWASLMGMTETVYVGCWMVWNWWIISCYMVESYWLIISLISPMGKLSIESLIFSVYSQGERRQFLVRAKCVHYPWALWAE